MKNTKWPFKDGWLAKWASEVQDMGQTITSPNYPTENWIDAVVPGT